MIDLILFSVSVGIVLVLVAVFLVGLYFGKGDIEYGYHYFKYNYLFNASSHLGAIIKDEVCYVKCKKKDLRIYKTVKYCAYSGQRYDLSHVTWITSKEYYEQTR